MAEDNKPIADAREESYFGVYLCCCPYVSIRRCRNKTMCLFILLLSCVIMTSSLLTVLNFSLPNLHFVSKKRRMYVGPEDRFDCAALINQEPGAVEEAEEYTALHPRKILEDGEYARTLAKNCTNFRLQGRYTTMNNVTKEERAFPLAYSIVLYKEAVQVENLLRAIYRPHNYYCIHVDRSSNPLVISDIRAIVRCLPNVIVASRLVDVEWGKFSETEAELVCMRDLLQKYKDWKYFINLTGQEYPLKTNLQIVRILQAFKGANDIAGVRSREYEFRTKFVFVNFRPRQKKGPPPHNITVSKGSIHITASRGYVNFLLNDRRAQDFTNWVKDTRNPDETLFTSLNHNPHLKVPGSFAGSNIEKKPFISRHKLWRNVNPQSCHGKWLRSVCVFGPGDLRGLTNTIKLFANKFEWAFKPLTLQCLSEWHFNRTRDEYQGLYYFSANRYKNMPQVVHRIT